jgi:hypothetical protein
MYLTGHIKMLGGPYVALACSTDCIMGLNNLYKKIKFIGLIKMLAEILQFARKLSGNCDQQQG